MGERSEEARRAEFEASREPTPDGRSLEDFPVGLEVVAYMSNYGQLELGNATIVGHTRFGWVEVRPRNLDRGAPFGRRDAVFKFSPRSPGLLRSEELESLKGSREQVRCWVGQGDRYDERESRRLVDKIVGYSGYDGPVKPPIPGDPVRKRSKGVNKAGWPGG